MSNHDHERGKNDKCCCRTIPRKLTNAEHTHASWPTKRGRHGRENGARVDQIGFISMRIHFWGLVGKRRPATCETLRASGSPMWTSLPKKLYSYQILPAMGEFLWEFPFEGLFSAFSLLKSNEILHPDLLPFPYKYWPTSPKFNFWHQLRKRNNIKWVRKWVQLVRGDSTSSKEIENLIHSNSRVIVVISDSRYRKEPHQPH